MIKMEPTQEQYTIFRHEQSAALLQRIRENHTRSIALVQLAREAEALTIAIQAPTIRSLFLQADSHLVL